MRKRHYYFVAGMLVLLCILCGWAASGQNAAFPKEVRIDIGRGIKMEFVLIPAGSFLMGDEKGTDREKPVRKVTLNRPFYLGKYEVTREQFNAVMKTEAGKIDKPNHPVDFARWEICREFLSRLNQQNPGKVFRLPTEAEWEYAARAGTASRYWFGNDEKSLSDYAWFGELAGGAAHPVGQKKPNPWGLHDMYGNVWEWCQDFYGFYEGKDQMDPSGPTTGTQHVFRGGAWNSPPDRCRSASRDSFPAAAFVLGFRLAMPVSPNK
jgi:formylglycine-generating enzyme required for sulfatase activity